MDRIVIFEGQHATAKVDSALIADDDEYFRIAMRNILVDRLGISNISETESFDEAIECLTNSQGTDLALFDLDMPGMNTRSNLRTVRQTFPEALVVVVSASCQRSDVLRCLEAGAHGYIHKSIGPRGLTAALRQICEGTVFVPPFLPVLAPPGENPVVLVASRSERDGDTLQRFTPRQREVLKLLVEGHSNKSIARQLDLSESAVKFHLSALFRHFGATNRVEAATHGAKLLTEASERSQ